MPSMVNGSQNILERPWGCALCKLRVLSIRILRRDLIIVLDVDCDSPSLILRVFKLL